MKWLIFLFTLSTLCADVTYIYNKDVEGRESKTIWTLDFKENDDLLHIKGESLSGETLIITSPNRVTHSFSHRSKHAENNYSIAREGAYLIANQEISGKKVQKEFHIGSDFWIQEFDFCFKPFILSNSRDFIFSIVDPKKFDLHQMVATKRGVEKIDIHGKIYDALKIKMTLTGFKKMFWHADLWFDSQTGDLLKYMANEGPNTPLSVITLFSKQVN